MKEDLSKVHGQLFSRPASEGGTPRYPRRKSLEMAVSEVAHALLRAASTLVPTPLDCEMQRCRHEWRHGKLKLAPPRNTRFSSRSLIGSADVRTLVNAVRDGVGPKGEPMGGQFFPLLLDVAE